MQIFYNVHYLDKLFNKYKFIVYFNNKILTESVADTVLNYFFFGKVMTKV